MTVFIEWEEKTSSQTNRDQSLPNSTVTWTNLFTQNTKIAVSEQFPQEILQERKRLLSHIKKAREDNRKVKLVRDKLYIDGQLFRNNAV